ncbi:hypothetical protein Glove_86g229 [Diversispora epigaea]|uniref:DUF659 domain-containing protein n=1 Tax=Diversispora epigaea TaxID=1348612 RepID=A0A397J6F8_9GLOM|nr:hypothetical protein Glove_86g229 [Diversispora epigaea]
MIDNENELLISISNRKCSGHSKNEVWQHFDIIPADSTNGKKDLYSGAACKFYKQKWSRGKTSEMIAHLVLQCPKHHHHQKTTLSTTMINIETATVIAEMKKKLSNETNLTLERLTITNDKQKKCSKALTKFFVTYEVPLTTLSTTMINIETATVIAEMKKKLSNETNLTLAGQSLYIFLIMTSDRKEYIHSLKNFSKNSHTGEFLKDEIIKVIEEVDVEKFCSIVSDHASNVVLAKNLVSTKYPHIFPIRCIAHYINLSHVVKKFAILQQQIIENMTKGGELKKYIITRWTIAYDCTDSIIRCKNALKQILENEPQLLNLEIISILRKQNFFRNVKDLRTILLPIKKAIINLKHKSTTLADCFINLVIMATAIKELSQTNTGLQINTFRIICKKALSIWKLLGGKEKFTNELIA